MRTLGSWFWLPMLLVVGANVLYHWAQKSVPASVTPLASLLVTYAAALAGTLLLLLVLDGPASVGPALRAVNLASLLVGLAIIGVELGFLLAYRAGWQLNLTSLTASVALAVLLVPLGSLAFREGWSLQRTIGLLLCLAGLVLIHRR